jgi:signal peptidase I
MAQERITAARPTTVPPGQGNGRPTEPVVSPSGKTKAKTKDEPRDVLREICETVVFVVVLVLMLKTFVAEAFVIPTGSMAETLYGYQKIVVCDQCKRPFAVNCSSEVDPQDNRPSTPITGAVCPNCQRQMDLSKADGSGKVPEWHTGDRVLVAKFLFDRGYLWHPKRHEVFVFKYPQEPQKGTTAMNYIKRVQGEPEETIAICGGDLYVTKSLKHPLPEGDPNDYWKPENMHLNDPKAVELFKESMRRRADGGAAPGDFEIIRKPPAECIAMRRIVFDNDFQPADLIGKISRWHIPQNGRWSGDDPKAPKTFHHSGTPGDTTESWISYAHILRQPGAKPPGFERDDRSLILNMQGYNTGEGDPNRDAFGEHWVGDLMLDCTVNVLSAQGELVFDLAKGLDRFQARFDLASGDCTLVRLTGVKATDMATQQLAKQLTKLKGTGTFHVRFGNFDERLTVWVNSGLTRNSLPFGDGVVYSPSKKRGPVGENDLDPAKIGVVNADVEISHLQLWRDTYYTLNENGVGRTETVNVGDSSERIQTYYVQPGHYLALGDNSSASADSRYWGQVPERLLLGRALMVYFPFWPFAPQTRFGFIQ